MWFAIRIRFKFPFSDTLLGLAAFSHSFMQTSSQLSNDNNVMYHSAVGADTDPRNEFGNAKSTTSLKKLTSKSVANKKAARVVIIKNLADTPALPADFEDTAWARLARTVAAIYESRAVDDSLEQLYNVVEALCNSGAAARLYQRLRDLMANYCGQQLYGQLASHLAADDSTLHAVDSVWTAFCEHSALVRSVFLHLDRTFVFAAAQQQQLTQTSDASSARALRRSLWEVALNDFRELVLQRNADALLGTVCNAVLALIARDRAGADIDRALARRVLRMLSTLDLYATHFEGALLASTAQHYDAVGTRAAAENDLRAYCVFVDAALAAESRRVDQYVDERSRRALLSVLERALLAWPTRLEPLCADERHGLPHLLALAADADLARLYRLVTRRGVALHRELRVAWCACVEANAGALVRDEAREATLIDELLALRARLDTLLRSAFAGDAALATAQRDSLERAINGNATRVAQLAARHADALLRRGVRKAADEIDAALERLVALFRLLHAKDVFEAFYAKLLAKRLLLGNSESDDAERHMVSRLKSEVGVCLASWFDVCNFKCAGWITVYIEIRSSLDAPRAVCVQLMHCVITTAGHAEGCGAV
jgi:cullin-4